MKKKEKDIYLKLLEFLVEDDYQGKIRNKKTIAPYEDLIFLATTEIGRLRNIMANFVKDISKIRDDMQTGIISSDTESFTDYYNRI